MHRPAQRCLADGFRGEVCIVNPEANSIPGIPAYRSLEDVPWPPDAAFVAVRRDLTIEAVQALAAKGAGGAVCYASGFAETGADGENAQARLVAAAAGMPFLGPNCYGFVNYVDGVTLWPGDHGGSRVERGVAILTQSGNMGFNLSMSQRSLNIAHILSVGNQASVTFAELIDALVDRPEVTAIGLHVEGLSDVAAFSSAALRALSRGVPVIALKVGTSDAGAELALTHTGSLAGSNATYSAFFDQIGVGTVNNVPQLLEALKLASGARALPSRRLRAITCSGGDAGLVADEAARHCLELSPLEATEQDNLRALLPSFAAVRNPLDFTMSLWGDATKLAACLKALRGQSSDTCLAVVDYPTLHRANADPAGWDAIVDAVIDAASNGGCCVLASVLPESLPAHVRERTMAAGVPSLQGLGDAFAAIAACATVRERAEEFRAAGISMAARPACLKPLRLGSLRTLGEVSSKALLRSAGVPVPRGKVASDTEAPAAALAIGFPVAVKVASDSLPHKTDFGAVALGLSSEHEVTEAASNMKARVPDLAHRFLVEEMIADGVAELLVGIHRDPVFGPVLVVASGGVLVELVADAQTVLLPAGERAIRQALARLKAWRLVDGYRGRSPGDGEAAVAAVRAIADFANSHAHTLVELDVNPLIVRPLGCGAVAVDALIRLVEPSTVDLALLGNQQ
ncbi:MAG: acetate--CoA ligase family protein [Hyphomicrobiaceae bacterium]|nr:acetate--CoA ligase family protein [Hyphomicrobiaceae bacterium]